MALKEVLILECLDKESDPGSEGRFISHMLRLMEIRHDYVIFGTKQELIQQLQSSTHTIIHISTHGSYKKLEKEKKFMGLWTGTGRLNQADLKILENKLKGRTIVCTACLSADEKFRGQFVKITKCSNYIAPEGRPSFYDAIFFAHIFYHKHLILKRSVHKSFKEYSKRYKNPHRFVLESQ